MADPGVCYFDPPLFLNPFTSFVIGPSSKTSSRSGSVSTSASVSASPPVLPLALSLVRTECVCYASIGPITADCAVLNSCCCGRCCFAVLCPVCLSVCLSACLSVCLQVSWWRTQTSKRSDQAVASSRVSAADF